jgi:hypothetical protein
MVRSPNYAVFIGREDAPVLTEDEKRGRTERAFEEARARDIASGVARTTFSALGVAEQLSGGELTAYEQMYEATIELRRQDAAKLGQVTAELITRAQEAGPLEPTQALLDEVHAMEPYPRAELADAA